jgi:hypothetical protein
VNDRDPSFADVQGAPPPAGLEDRILAVARARRRGWRFATAAVLLVAACAGLNLLAARRIESLRREDFEARTGLPYESREPCLAPAGQLLPEEWAILLTSLQRRA